MQKSRKSRLATCQKILGGNNKNKMSCAALLGYFCEIHGPSLIMATVSIDAPVESVMSSISRSSREDQTRSCVYCHSFDIDLWPCFVSNGFDQGNLVSSRNGGGINVDISILKHICMRSLSCEIGKSFLITDNLVGHGDVACYNFNVPDPEARGFRRTYCLAFLSMSSDRDHARSVMIKTVLPMLETISTELWEDSANLISISSEEQRKAFMFLHVRLSQLLNMKL